MSRTDKRNLILAILVFLFVNFSIPFAIGYRWSKSSRAASSWPETTGSIKSTHYQGDYQDVEIVYEYAVEGQTYEGSRIRFGFPGDLRDLVQASRNGSAVQVHYHPSDPSTSVLLTEISAGTQAMTTIGSAGMILSALTAFGVWRHFRDNPPTRDL